MPPVTPSSLQEDASRRKKEMEEWELKRKTHEKPSDLEQVGLSEPHWVGTDRHVYTPLASSEAMVFK